MTLQVIEAGPALTVQDLGRPGHAGQGLSPGGAADPLALWEAAALLGHDDPVAAIEMVGMGGTFGSDVPIRFALTGAPMRARIGERALAWNAVHRLSPGETLRIGPAETGSYGYLTPAGGITTEPIMGSRSAHLSAGIAVPLQRGEYLPIQPDPAPDTRPMRLRADRRFAGGEVRIMPGPQSAMFADAQRAAFAAAAFARGPRSNRQAAELATDLVPEWHLPGAQLASEPIVAGDVQITGDGTPFVLLAECQTIGGYPRIGTVLPADLPRVAQAGAGAVLRFRFVTLDEAVAAQQRPEDLRRAAQSRLEPLIRSPAEIPDLLSYQLISGVTDGRDLDP